MTSARAEGGSWCNNESKNAPKCNENRLSKLRMSMDGLLNRPRGPKCQGAPWLSPATCHSKRHEPWRDGIRPQSHYKEATNDFRETQTTIKRHKATIKRCKETQNNDRETQCDYKDTKNNYKETQNCKEIQNDYKVTQSNYKETQNDSKETQNDNKETQSYLSLYRCFMRHTTTKRH